MIVVLMGVSGSGKTTVGRLLATSLGADYAEGDAFHPPANVEKMRGGTPLDDADRWPWLAAIAAEIDRHRAAEASLVVGCSALKRAYRDVLIGHRTDVRLAHLAGAPEVIRARIESRPGHFMPPALLVSQFQTLEPPGADERAIVADIALPPEEIARHIVRALASAQPGNASPSAASAFRIGGKPA